MNFQIISEITDVETIAVGSRIRDFGRLRKLYGKGRWRKLKGSAQNSPTERTGGIALVPSARYRSEGNEA